MMHATKICIQLKPEVSPTENIPSSNVDPITVCSADKPTESKPDINLDLTDMSDTTESEAEKQAREFIVIFVSYNISLNI